LIVGHKTIWARCTSLPISLWNKDCFAKVVGEVASLVSVDKATENWENIEYARFRVRLLRCSKANLNKDIKINGVVYSH